MFESIVRMLLVACALGTSIVYANDGVSREDQFKAAYLFNFLKFVDWPANVSHELLTVCFIGADGVHDALATGIENKRAGARRLAVRRLGSNSALDGCNALYLDAEVGQSTARVAMARERSILTVSDAEAFARHGGMIELFTDANRLRFNINIDNAQEAGLRISSNLLQLAAQVERRSKP